MNRVSFAKWSCFVLGLGSLIPGAGCLSGDDDNEGRICASPIEGGKYCVSASSGPSAAWNDAMANGSEPIEMWAVWPSKYELRDVVSSPILLDAWLDDGQAILDYVRVTKGSAESYRATMNGKMADDLRQARQLQGGLVREPIDPVVFVQSEFFQNAIKGETAVNVKIWADKEALTEMQIVVEQAKFDGAPFATQYKTLVDDFLAYRATEAAETLLYTQWSHEISAATLAELPGVENEVVKVAQKASAKPNELLMSGMKLTAEILQFDKTTREALLPHETILIENGARMPDFSSSALRSVHAMLGYAQHRVARSDATGKSLLLGAAMRRNALQLLANADSPARSTIANALLAKAGTTFAQSAQVQVDAIQTVQMSKLGVPYLAPRYDEHAALLQMVSLCNATSSSWRETGCVSMRPKFKDAGMYLKVTLPAEIKQGLTFLKNQGVDALMIEKVQQKLDKGDIKGAALVHDVLLQSSEGT
jgi:hypothetical protein